MPQCRTHHFTAEGAVVDPQGGIDRDEEERPVLFQSESFENVLSVGHPSSPCS